ncbi:MAG: N-acetylglucosamine-6-phosphate deacetylase [Acidobacteriota bacterium]
MGRVNDTFIFARRIVTPEEEREDGWIRIRDGRIEEMGAGTPRPNQQVYRGSCLIPGMIDLHSNGVGGCDAAEGTASALEIISRTLPRYGATGFLATIITNQKSRLLESLRALASLMDRPFTGARALGIHLEGPFISPHRPGVHPADCLQRPSPELFQEYYRASRGWMKMLTLAPEVPGALAIIPEARQLLPIVSLGHTDADYASAARAIEAGANLATHVFNAMGPLRHRTPGILAAVLNSDIFAAVIADGIHVHPAIVQLLVRCKGLDRIILVTDQISAAGMPDGPYRIGSLEVHLSEGVCRGPGGKLAGSILQMSDGLSNLNGWLPGRALRKIVATATLQPAQLLGLERKGRIRPGNDADLVLLDEDLKVLQTWVEGELVYDSEAGG